MSTPLVLEGERQPTGLPSQADFPWKKPDNWNVFTNGITTLVTDASRKLSKVPSALARGGIAAGLLATLTAGEVRAQTGPTISPPGCQFILGFKTIDDALPQIVGQCLDNQAFAANGDALQHTTGGLLAWRKTDNFTAFTDGATSWVNGPYGIQDRPNSARFFWESPQPISRTTTVDNVEIRDYSPDQYPQVRGTIKTAMGYDKNLTRVDFVEFFANPKIQTICGSNIDKVKLLFDNLGDAQKAFRYVKYVGISKRTDVPSTVSEDGGLGYPPALIFGDPSKDNNWNKTNTNLNIIKEYRSEEIFQMIIETHDPNLFVIASEIEERAGLFLMAKLIFGIDGPPNDWKSNASQSFLDQAFNRPIR